MSPIKSHLKNKTHVIWDWNGTILNDVDLCVEIIGEVLHKWDLNRICRDTYRRTFRFPIREYYKDLGFDLERLCFEEVSKSFIDQYNQRVLECELHPGFHELLDELRAEGVRSSVLSAAHEGDLRALLDKHRITEYFDHIYGLDDRHAAGKIARGQALIKEITVPRDEIILIGDTDHDLEVGNELGIDVLLIGDGHQCDQKLSSIHDKVIMNRTQSAVLEEGRG